MKGLLKRLFAAALALVLLLSVGFVPAFAAQEDEYTVIFTHDLHSHFLPVKGENGEPEGGYARIMTEMEKLREEYPGAVTLDGGDFSMGSLFQTGFKDYALELQVMGMMGYDVTTFGNHEFDYLPEGLALMLKAAKKNGEKLPQIVEANYKAPADTEDGKLMQEAFDLYGVKEYTIIEREGLYYAVFGIFGKEAHEYSPNSGMNHLDPAATAQKTLDAAVKECKDKYGKEPLVVCLSHSGTNGNGGEDIDLAKNVKGIDLIVSGHSHSTTAEPIQVGDTYIVSCGDYGRKLGVVNLKKTSDKADVTGFELVDINSSIPENKEIADFIEKCKEQINEGYLAPYGVSFDEVLLNNPYEFDSVDDVRNYHHESTLGNLFSDAYKWAAEKETGERVHLALTASGVIRETLHKGAVTVSDVFETSSLGVGTEGELVMLYLTGKDLMSVLEVDASIYPIMDSVQLFCSGVKYSLNEYRMIFNKVDKAELITSEGNSEKIENDKLYRVVTGMYIAQMLGTVKEKSFGLVSITPRDENGNPIGAEDFVNFVVKDEEGNPLKEWYAISSYLQQMGGEMDERYSATDGRKVVYKSLWPWDMLRNPNIFTFVALGVILLVVGIIVLVTVLIVKKVRKKKKLKQERLSATEEKALEENQEEKSSENKIE